MNKQSSLTSFFKKAPSSDSVTTKANELARKHEQLDIVEPAPSQDTQSTTQTSVDPLQTSMMEEEDENLVTKKLFKRLKKSVKIADDDEEFVPPPEETPAKKAPVTRKSASKKGRNDDYDDDDDEDFETPKKSSTKPPAKKKKKVSDDDDEDDFVPSPTEVGSTKKKSAAKGKSQKKEKAPSATPAKDAPHDELIDIGKNEGNAFDYKDFDDSTPEWAKQENAKDAKGKRPGDPGYDPTTLYVPPSVFSGKEVTPTMKQYWQIKSQNYDKIVLFKLGKFYELFYEDALVCHRELDLNWMGNKMHVGFPEKALERYGHALVSKGYKVCVVEQTETPKQMEERVKKQTSGKKEKLIRREMVQVMSKGTYVDLQNTDTEPKVLLSIRHRNDIFSVCFIEMGANVISVGSFKDDENYTLFKTFISQVRPVEVIYETIETNPTLLKIIRSCPTDPVMSPLNDPKAWNSIQGLAQLETYYGPKESWPEALQLINKMDGSQKDSIITTMSGLITYLTKMLIAENVMTTARYELYDPATFKLSRMVLDSQALQHLEILEVGYSCKNPLEGSLLGYVDKTVSPFGKRLMRKWICAPLLDVRAINDRLDAVEDLGSLFDLRDKFRVELKALPDLERACARIYNQGVKKKETVVMFEDVAGSRLREFKKVLESLRKATNIIKTLSGTQVKSTLLTKLTTLEDYKSIMDKTSENMPNVLPLLDEMAKFVVWEGPKQENPAPAKGIDKDYESCKAEIKKIEGEFDDYLKTIKAKLGGSSDICYAHAKHRYEIEIPAKLVSGNKKPKDFEFSSKRADRERFITSYIKDQVEKLEEAEDRLKATLNVFVCFLFNFFHKHYLVWDRFIEGLAQLDCLCSLSVVSYLSDGVMCRPELYPPNEKVFLDVRDMRHPCVSMSKTNFISNDIILGDVEDFESNKNVIILTGPNMGGKSTILRQACIAAIIAQLGCYVPASSCKLSVVDRIFTRIGASDRLFEGKSTFYIEMEETVNVMKYGTMNSLAIMDELGRGTSTFDGVAIAYSVMNYIVNKLGCRTLFATHYHVLLDEFRENKHMKFFHMSSRIDNDNERVIFLYKLIQGECSNSFGLNIARISGMDPHVVKVAKEKADEFEKNLNIREAVKTSKAFGKITKALGYILKEDENIEANLEAISEALQLYAASS